MHIATGSADDDFKELARALVEARARKPRAKIDDKPKLAAWFVRQWQSGQRLEELDEARALKHGVSVKQHRQSSLQRDADRRRALETHHAWRCGCDITTSLACDGFQAAVERHESETGCTTRIAQLEVREWPNPKEWAAALGGPLQARVYELTVKKPGVVQAALDEAQAEVAHGMSYYFEKFGDHGWQNFAVVARYREIFERKIEIAYSRM